VRERTWLTCDSPTQMLEQLARRRSQRKLRLLAAACCRRVWHLLEDERLRAAVEASERFADGEITPAAFDRARAAARKATQTSRQPSAERYVGAAVLTVVCREPSRLCWAPNDLLIAVSRSAAWHRYQQGGKHPSDRAAAQREKGPFCDLIRCIFGNPFRPPALNPAWRTPAVVALARTIYEERRFEELPVLADALEEVGCADEAFLGHIRGPGPHVRGCHALDLILDRE
jgi:hypothetical protein